MSQRKEKHLRRTLTQYDGIARDVDYLMNKVEFMDRDMRIMRGRVAETDMSAQWYKNELRLSRKERRLRTRRMQKVAIAFAAALLIGLAGWGIIKCKAAESTSAAPQAITIGISDEEHGPRIENLTYLKGKPPLTYEDQDKLRSACREFNIPYPIALAMIERESKFQNVSGDGGTAIGYMQVREHLHRDRMVRLGVTDLWNSSENFRVACDFLAENLEKYGDMGKALMAYNMGPTGASKLWDKGVSQSEYSKQVLQRAEYWASIL